MFKYKLVLLSTIILFACGKQKESVKVENGVRHSEVIKHTDSLIDFADKKIDKIKKNHKQQVLEMESLQNTIKVEQYTINNLNKEFRRIEGVDEKLQLTKKELETALYNCKIKEEKLIKLGDSLTGIREQLKEGDVIGQPFPLNSIKSYKICQ